MIGINSNICGWSYIVSGSRSCPLLEELHFTGHACPPCVCLIQCFLNPSPWQSFCGDVGCRLEHLAGNTALIPFEEVMCMLMGHRLIINWGGGPFVLNCFSVYSNKSPFRTVNTFPDSLSPYLFQSFMCPHLI